MSDRLRRLRPRERVGPPRWILGGYLLMLAVILLWPTPVDRGARPAISAFIELVRDLGFAWFSYAVLEIGANVLLFVPLGVLLVLALPRRRWWLAILIGAGISATGELVQSLVLPERVPTVVDVAANVLGLLIGVAVVLLIRSTRRRV